MPDYDLSTKLSEVIERVLYLIENATPTLAPSVVFQQPDDETTTLENLTDPDGRIRRFEVVSQDPAYGNLFWGSTKASYALILKIRIGYPLSRYYPEPDDETVDGDRFLVEHLINHDRKIICQLLEDADNFGAIDSLSAISDVQLALLKGELIEYSGRVRSMLWGVQIVETFTNE